MKSKSYLALAFGIGVVAGLRTMTAPAAVARAARRRPRALRGSSLSFLNSPRTANILSLLAMGEYVADKLPFIPSRISPPSMIVRLLSGALTGAAVSTAEEAPLLEGALLGAGGAIAGALGGYHLRRFAGRKLHVPDLVIAPLEDMLALSAANYITSRW